MAIENLKYERDDFGPEAPSRMEIAEKINEIIDYLNSQDTKEIIRIKDNGSTRDSTWTSQFNPDDVVTATNPEASYYRVYSHDIEQEPNKVELVPLDDIDALADYIKFAAMAHSGDQLSKLYRSLHSPHLYITLYTTHDTICTIPYYMPCRAVDLSCD